ncbi:MAG: hypothetical protein ACUVQP_08560 [Bacteroidales bacterium]
MAKVNMPLLGISATGQLGKSLVYFNWKGLNVVRRYIIPTNPRSGLQQTQRGYFSDAIEAFHNANFTVEDRQAWNTLASLSPSPMSGFNAFIQGYISALISEMSFTILRNMNISNRTSSSATITFNIGSDKNSKLFWGTSKTFMSNQVTGSFSSGVVTFNLTDLPPSSNIYFRVFNTATGEAGFTGIYSFRTL